jgi:hypothetical protein
MILDGDAELKPHPLISLLQVLDSLLSRRLRGLSVGTMGPPVSHPFDGVGDPMSHIGHVHGWPHSSAHKRCSSTTRTPPLRSGCELATVAPSESPSIASASEPDGTRLGSVPGTVAAGSSRGSGSGADKKRASGGGCLRLSLLGTIICAQLERSGVTGIARHRGNAAVAF